ncbi:MAG: hypothetical protein ABF242_04070 [Flavobacteriales bacterium]
MKNIKHITLFLAFVMAFLNGFSQNDTIIETDAVGTGDRLIKPTKKRPLTPILIEDTTKSQIKSKFLFYEYKASSEFQLQPISAAKLKIIDPLNKLKRGYVKGGIGMYTTPLVEVYYNSLRSKNSSWGIHGKHLSSNSSIKETGFSGLSENKANAFYTHYAKKYALTGEIDYLRSGMHFYGFNPEDTAIDKVDTRQVFNSIGGKIKIASFDTDTGELNYEGSLAYNNYSDRYDASENNIALAVNAKKMVNSEIYGVDFGVDFNTYSSLPIDPVHNGGVVPLPGPKTAVTVNNTIIKVMPNITTSGKRWYARVGLGIFADINDKTSFHFYPNAEAKYSFHDIFVPYIGINGGLERNSFRSLTTENPFLLSQVRLQNTNTRYNIYAGVRGSISNTISFNAQVARRSVYGNSLFVNDTTYSNQNKMFVVYDSMDVTELSAQIMYDQTDKFRVYLNGKYSIFSPLNQDYVWNTPALDITLGGIYDLADKIMVRADIFFMGNRKAKSLTFVDGAELNNDNSYTVDLKPIVDFNIGFEYRYSKIVSAFLNFNNIVSRKYQQFYLYPVQGINIMGGATLRF